jgi:hypothetical protein
VLDLELLAGAAAGSAVVVAAAGAAVAAGAALDFFAGVAVVSSHLQLGDAVPSLQDKKPDEAQPATPPCEEQQPAFANTELIGKTAKKMTVTNDAIDAITRRFIIKLPFRWLTCSI